MRATWLPDVLRDAGVPVRTYSGWTSRGAESWGPIRGVVCHATAGSRNSTDEGEMRVLWVTGSSSAPAPISQLYLSRSGEWTVGASGRCNHVLTGQKGPHEGFGNSHLIGVEAQNDNRGEPWSSRMLDSYQRGVAAILRHLGLPAPRAVAHWEHQFGKSDPAGINMTTFRAAVARLIEGDDDVSYEDVWERDQMAAPAGYTEGDTWRPSSVLRSAHLYSRLGYEQAKAAVAGQQAILAAVAGQDVAEAVKVELAKHDKAMADRLSALIPAMAGAVRDAVPEANQETVEAALRQVLGALDNA